MSFILTYKVIIAALAFAVLLLWERLCPVLPKLQNTRLFKNIGFWPINVTLSVLFVLPISAFASDISLWDRGASNEFFILDMLLLDLFLYGWHRLVHENNFLWRFHQVHHLDETLDVTNALRFHFGEIFLSAIPRAFIIFIAGIPFVHVLLFETVVLLAAFFHHANITLPKPLEKMLSHVIVTPSYHRMHHHAKEHGLRSNYSTIFSVWDRIFGTRNTKEFESTLKIGVPNNNDKNYIQLLKLPFRR